MNASFNKLNSKEKEILYCLSVIPILYYSIPELREMFRIDDDEQYAFFDTVHDLSIKGYLLRNNALYGIKPEYAKFIIENNKPTFEDCSAIINPIIEKLEKGNLDYDKEFYPIYNKLKYLLLKISGYSFHLAQLSYLLSSNLVKYKKYDEALKYNQLAVEISEAIDKKHPSVAIFYRNKALIHKKMGDTNLSIYCSLKDIQILEQNAGKYDDLLPGSYFNLSKTYEDIQNYEKAIEYNLKAIQCEKKRKPEKSINLIGLYQNLSYCYMKMNNMRNASLFIDKAIEIFSSAKLVNNDQYKVLLRDQRRFKSIYRIEKFVLKFKYHILFIAIVLLIIMVWGLVIILA